VRRVARLAAVAIGAAVVWLSLTPQPPSPPTLPAYADLVAHVAMHGALATALALGWPGVVAWRAALFLAVFLEVGQAQVPGRTFSLLDLTANGVGAAAGLFVGGLVAGRLSLAARG
jgi:VanZ family protein